MPDNDNAAQIALDALKLVLNATEQCQFSSWGGLPDARTKDHCPDCGGRRHEGHRLYCDLSFALANVRSAIADIEGIANGGECMGFGRCHGSMNWCDNCGDVSGMCDMRECGTHAEESEHGD